MKISLYARRSLTRSTALILLAFCSTALASSTEFEMHNPTIAGGGAITQAECFRLIATIGEGVAGTTSKQEFRLTSGFPATIHDKSRDGSIFSDGFEVAGPPADSDNSGACVP